MNKPRSFISGFRFGKLVLLERDQYDRRLWRCQCDCGKTVLKFDSSLDDRSSCGCDAGFGRTIKKKFNDFTGKQNGRLLILRRIGTRCKQPEYEAICECGNIANVLSGNLKRTHSCGCLNSEMVRARQFKHGYALYRNEHTLYRRWQGMKARCYNENEDRYPIYGGRGITVCDEWKDDFIAFCSWALQNGFSEELEIERIDNDGNYCPKNCRWATHQEQYLNKRNTIRVEVSGETIALKQYFTNRHHESLMYSDVVRRIKKGWDPILAIALPRGTQLLTT